MNLNSSFIVALFVIGNIVGSGFFMLPAKLAPLGINLVYSWAIAGGMATVFAIMFGSLCMLFPKSSVLSDYFNNPIFKKLVAIVYWISCIFGNTSLLVVIVASLNFSNPVLVGAIIMSLLTIANGAVRYSVVARIEVLLTVIKFFILAGLPISLFIINRDVFSLPVAQGTQSDVFTIGISCMWAFLGIETASIFGSGVAARRGLLIGVISCTLLYVISSLLVVGSAPADELANSSMPFALLIRQFFGVGAEKYLGFLIAFTSFGALYGWVAATSKMGLAYAETNIFPKAFLKKANSDTSFLGLLVSSLASFAIFVCLSGMNINKQFNFTADLCVYITLAIYAFCGYVLLRNSKKIFHYFIGLFSILSVVVSFVFNLEMAFFALATMILVGLFIFYTHKLIAAK